MVAAGLLFLLACTLLLVSLGLWAGHFVVAVPFPLILRVAIFAGLDDADQVLRNASALFEKMGSEVLFFGPQRWLAEAEQFVLLALWLWGVLFLLYEGKLATAAMTLLSIPFAPLCFTVLLGTSAVMLVIFGLIVDVLPLTPDPRLPGAVDLFSKVVRLLWAYESGFYTLLLHLCVCLLVPSLGALWYCLCLAGYSIVHCVETSRRLYMTIRFRSACHMARQF